MKTFLQRGQLMNASNLVAFRRFSVVQLSSVKRDDVVGATDTKWVGNFAKAVLDDGDASG